MILVDELLSFEGPWAVVEARIRDGQAWVRDGRVPATFCIEYMAQTVGCYAGMTARSRGQDVRIGFLLGTRELTLEADYLYVGDRLTISAKHVFGDEKLGSFECEIRRDDERIATATLNVFRGELSEVLT
jgi:predicted hotdog family 3-hydroxylacyl-ACP dehydratase